MKNMNNKENTEEKDKNNRPEEALSPVEDELADYKTKIEEEVTDLLHPEGYHDIVLPTSDQEYHGHKPRNLWEKISAFLANDIVAGLILIAAAIIALACANLPFHEFYQDLANYHFGPEALHLHLSLKHWAQDGVLTIFFFIVGLELKQEFVIGSLRNPKVAALPIIAALFGMIGPASIYLLSTYLNGDNAWHGWAIPTATDIAFAVAILQIFGRALPNGARTFLLTLAVADDLGGIIVIAVFYATGLNFLFLAISLASAGIFGYLTKKRILHWWLLLPLGISCWYFMHASGVHATIAGVVLGMLVPVHRLASEKHPLTEYFAESLNPISTGFAVPVFAFFAAGVNVVDVPGGVYTMFTNPVAISVLLAMPVGKFLGIFGSVAIFTKITSLKLEDGVTLKDIFPVSLTAGIGFTVALLISHLAFQGNNLLTQAGSLGVLLGTGSSVILAALTLTYRGRQIKRQKQNA